MNENASSNITQILTCFETFINTYDDPLWVTNTNPENIKSTFKLGLFIEKTIDKFKSKDYLPQFFQLLEIWCKKNNLKMYSEEFFALANDQMLEKLFKYNNVKETTLDIGVRVYSSIYPKERFKKFLHKLILISSSISAIAEFLNLYNEDAFHIGNTLVLSRWIDFLTCGQENLLKSELDNYLSIYKVSEMLPKLLSILCLKDCSVEIVDAQKIVLQCILQKMFDRSVLSKNFWVTLFKSVKKQDLAQVCCNFRPFLESLLNFTEYLGSFFQKDPLNSLEWKSIPDIYLYPEIDYFDILCVLKGISNLDVNSKESILERLNEIREHSSSELWVDLQSEISDLQK